SGSNAPAPSPASVPNEGKQPKSGGSKIGGASGGVGGSAGEPSGASRRGTTIVGQVTDQRGRGIEGALILALQPGVSVREFVQSRSESQVAAQSETDRSGEFSLGPLGKGKNYSLLVIAQGYQDIAVDEALRISGNAPDQAQMQPIALPKD
ncbi:MAG TPA: carboxypeptidase-like regulatory domain-containing protein, partial [Anaerolineales bacterium]|nr:carboxypeptidase-like regulatory domain-containing protein [Anaerolineales bacterium]